MRILYISPMTIPSRSADSIQVVKACDSLAGLGHTLELRIPYRKKHEVISGDVFSFYECENNFKIEWQQIPLLPESFAILLIAFKAAFDRHDIVFSRSIPAALLCCRLGKKVFVEIHEPLNRTKAAEVFARLLVKCKNLRGVITNCEGLKAYTVQVFPELKGKCVSIQNGSSEPKITRSVEIGASGDVQVGYSGQLYKGKGMEIVAALAPRLPSVKFHIVGGLENDIASWKSELENAGNVTFHGFIKPAELPSYLAALDIVLAPYQTVIHGFNSQSNLAKWTSPMKVFDYMASGKAIIASDLPFIREILNHESDALLCSPEDVDAWQEAVERLSRDKDLSRKLGNSARVKYQAEFTWKKRAQKISKFIEEGLI